MPDTGRLEVYVRPQGPGVRIDDGYEQGLDIPIYYDPMIGKLVVWGATRSEAIDRMDRAIRELRINGIETTLPFGLWAIHQPAFLEGKYDTHFIEKYYKPEYLASISKDEAELAGLIAVNLYKKATEVLLPLNKDNSKWRLRQQNR